VKFLLILIISFLYAMHKISSESLLAVLVLNVAQQVLRNMSTFCYPRMYLADKATPVHVFTLVCVAAKGVSEACADGGGKTRNCVHRNPFSKS